MSNQAAVIGWFPKNDFDGGDTELLFDDNFCPLSTRQQGGDDVTTTNIILKASKNIVSSPIKSWRSIFIEATLNVIFNYKNHYR